MTLTSKILITIALVVLLLALTAAALLSPWYIAVIFWPVNALAGWKIGDTVGQIWWPMESAEVNRANAR